MKVSIIIPFHKGIGYLKDCLDSLSEQSYQNFEVIICCDHAEEDLSELLKDYSALTINLYTLEEEKNGVAAARNLGLSKATGDYIYFLDSDDYIFSDTIELLVLAALEEGADITYGKKKWTWFQRSIFLATYKVEEEDESEDEQEESAIETAQLNAEGGDMDTKHHRHDKHKASEAKEDITSSGSEENNTEDSSDGNEENEAEAGEEEDSGVNFSDENEEMEELNLSPEELALLKERRKHRQIVAANRILISKRRGIRNISVLNVLFKRSLIEDNQLRFMENLKYFSDVPFLLEAMSYTDSYKRRLAAKYIKRRHNDSVNLPALSQIKDSTRFYDFIDAYMATIKKLPVDSDLRIRLDKKMISYYIRVYSLRLKRNKRAIWKQENFRLMSDIVNQMSPLVFENYKGYNKRLIKALKKNDVEKSIKMVKARLAKKKLKKILRSRRAFAKFIYIHSFLKKPVKENYILFESFFGKNYSDSPKYIYEYMAKTYGDKYKYIWVIDKKGTKIPYQHTKVKRFSLRYMYYLARCNYFVFNGRQPEWSRKRKGTKFLETWHGTPLKRLVFDQDDVSSATPRYKEQVYKQSRAWDYLIAPNEFCSEVFRRCFMFEKTMLETGYPRNDILHAKNKDEIAANIRAKLQIPEGKKTILYAPTWRDDEFYGKGEYKFTLQMDLRKMREALGQEYVVLLRTHYFIADSLDVTGVEDFAINVSKYDDISELYLISDILITDYSSVFFDFANLKRPMLFFTYDLEKYRDVLRGFYIDMESEVPGPLVFDTEQIIDGIKNIDVITKKYEEKYKAFYQRFCGWEDGNASKKVVEAVFTENA